MFNQPLGITPPRVIAKAFDSIIRPEFASRFGRDGYPLHNASMIFGDKVDADTMTNDLELHCRPNPNFWDLLLDLGLRNS